MKKFFFYFTPGIEFLKFIVVFLLATLLVCMASCSPLKRLERFERKHPYLFDRSLDTLMFVDSFRLVIPGTKIDTFVPVTQLKTDTVYFQKDNVTVKAYIYRDTLYLTAKTDTIIKTIIRKIKVPYTKNNTYRKPRDKLRIRVTYFVIPVLLLIIWALAYKKEST